LRFNKIILLFLIVAGTTNSQTVGVFPGELNIQPFTANFLEPRMGVFFQMGKNDLRLDIGASKDIWQVQVNEDTKISMGADFFTFTRLRGEEDFHFPVDAVDYLFGVNWGIKRELPGNREWGARLRLSHISAHFVDGHYEGTKHDWRDGREPMVYSREFFEFMYYYRVKGVRVYGGVSYLFHTSPSEIEPWIFQAGADAFPEGLSSGNFYPFIAYDYKLAYTTAYTPNHTLQFGIKYGHPAGSGLRLVFTLFQGKNPHGEYYDIDERNFSAGFSVDF